VLIGVPAEAMQAARATLGSGTAAVAEVPTALQSEFLVHLREAFTDSMNLMAMLGMAVLIVTAAWLLRLRQKIR
jgi:hypothetical protein